MKKWIPLFFILAVGILSPLISQAEAIRVDFFYSAICPHCAKEEVFLERMEKEYSDIEIRKYEVYYDSANRELFKEAAQRLSLGQLAVPLTVIGEKYFLGYQDDETTGKAIEDYLQSVLGGDVREGSQIIKIPFFGGVDLSKMSLPVLTITLGALDGFNPCAMWVLLLLIALLINTRSRKRMWLIGGTFLLASGLVYYLILAAWLNLFLAVSYVNLTRILIGVFAVGVGVWQLANFFRYRPGTCKVTDGRGGMMDKIKDKIKNHTEKLALSPITFGILAGVIILALAVNLIEFFCSAGFPAIFTRVLALNQLGFLSYNLYLLLYTFVFMLDDLIIFSLAMVAFSKFGFTDKYNYWATLVGGLLILILGLLLIFKPEFLMF